MTEPKAWEANYGFCAFHETPIAQLVQVIEEKVRRRACIYGGGRCDCKYTHIGKPGSEASGCPELLELMHRALHRPETLVPDGAAAEWRERALVAEATLAKILEQVTA